MTNFEPIKEKIWKAAQNQNKEKFDKECNNLVKKATNDWWRIGWSIYPKNVGEIVKWFDKLAKKAHTLWIKAVKSGDAPNEDISPGEGFALCSNLIKNAIAKKDNNIKCKSSNTSTTFKIIFHAFEGGMNEVEPGICKAHQPINGTYTCCTYSLCDAINKFIAHCYRNNYQHIVVDEFKQQ